MEEPLTFSTSFFISPASVRPGLCSSVLEDLRSRKAELTTRERGIVTSIGGVRVTLGSVAHSGAVPAEVGVTGTHYLPQEGHEVEAEVVRVLNLGVLCTFLSINVWIKAENMKPLAFDGDAYVNGGSRVGVGSSVSVRVSAVRYEVDTKEFSCIGSLMERDYTAGPRPEGALDPIPRKNPRA